MHPEYRITLCSSQGGWYTSQAWFAFVCAHEKTVFTPTFENIIFSIDMSGNVSMCVLLLHSRSQKSQVFAD